jgi:hypothetical protein
MTAAGELVEIVLVDLDGHSNFGDGTKRWSASWLGTEHTRTVKLVTDDVREIVAFAAAVINTRHVDIEGVSPPPGGAPVHNGILYCNPFGCGNQYGDWECETTHAEHIIQVIPIPDQARRIHGDFMKTYTEWRNRFCAELLHGLRQPFVVTPEDRERWRQSFDLVRDGALPRMPAASRSRVVRECRLVCAELPEADRDRLKVMQALRALRDSRTLCGKPRTPEPDAVPGGPRR